jgi:hypothetical protein
VEEAVRGILVQFLNDAVGLCSANEYFGRQPKVGAVAMNAHGMEMELGSHLPQVDAGDGRQKISTQPNHIKRGLIDPDNSLKEERSFLSRPGECSRYLDLTWDLHKTQDEGLMIVHSLLPEIAEA